jgi:hypothetical protein
VVAGLQVGLFSCGCLGVRDERRAALLQGLLHLAFAPLYAAPAHLSPLLPLSPTGLEGEDNPQR